MEYQQSIKTVAIFEGDHEIDDMPDVKTELFEDLEVRREQNQVWERTRVNRRWQP